MEIPPCDGLKIRPNLLAKAGDVTNGHVHHFDHITIVFIGAIRVVATAPSGRKWDKTFRAPAYVTIKADCTHEITALEDNTVYWCVFAERYPDGTVSPVYRTGFEDAWT